MILISHRRNLIEELKDTPRKYGVEIDIRTKGKDLIINHDPCKNGALLKAWLEFYDHSLLILNVKEDGLEEEILDLLKKTIYNIVIHISMEVLPWMIDCVEHWIFLTIGKRYIFIEKI